MTWVEPKLKHYGCECQRPKPVVKLARELALLVPMQCWNIEGGGVRVMYPMRYILTASRLMHRCSCDEIAQIAPSRFAEYEVRAQNIFECLKPFVEENLCRFRDAQDKLASSCDWKIDLT